MSQLSREELGAALARLQGWSEQSSGLERRYDFADYYEVMAFVNALAFVAHHDDHHPDLSVHFNRVHVRFTTHDQGGITALDVSGATQAEALYARAIRA